MLTRINSKTGKPLAIFACFILLWIEACATAPVTAGGAGNGTNALVFADICRHSLADYPNLRDAFLKQYPVAIAAEKLLARLRSDLSPTIDGLAVADLSALKQGREPNRDPNVALWKRDSKMFQFQRRCSIGKGNRTIWSIAVLVDRNGAISGRSIQPLLDEDTNFSARQIPLNLDFFSTDDGLRRALHSLMPSGIHRTQALAVMTRIEGGFYADFVEAQSEFKNSITYFYRANDANLGVRLAPQDLGFAVTLRFDDRDRLLEITVY